jgi:hypothetical protein
MKFVYSKVYPDYQTCMEARKEWDNKGFVALCSVKAPKETDKKP